MEMAAELGRERGTLWIDGKRHPDIHSVVAAVPWLARPDLTEFAKADEARLLTLRWT